MRSDQEIFDQLLNFARSHETIRAVVMNGSRANPNAPHDLFCDYDIVYFCTDPRPFFTDESWIAQFGELTILQRNEWEERGLDGVIYLMLFTDGVRIDLAYNHLANLPYITEDSMTVVLLDKDDLAPALPPASDAGYYPQRPTRKEFNEAVNEVFWCSNNAAKGIWRDELPYVKFMQDVIIRDALLKLLEWYAASLHGWSIGLGYKGKWLKKFLPAEVWEMVPPTYAGADYEQTWDAVFAICRLARKIGQPLAAELGYEYPLQDDERVLEYLRKVRALPKKN